MPPNAVDEYDRLPVGKTALEALVRAYGAKVDSAALEYEGTDPYEITEWDKKPPETAEEIAVEYDTTPPETELLDKVPVPLATLVEFDNGYGAVELVRYEIVDCPLEAGYRVVKTPIELDMPEDVGTEIVSESRILIALEVELRGYGGEDELERIEYPLDGVPDEYIEIPVGRAEEFGGGLEYAIEECVIGPEAVGPLEDVELEVGYGAGDVDKEGLGVDERNVPIADDVDDTDPILVCPPIKLVEFKVGYGRVEEDD